VDPWLKYYRIGVTNPKIYKLGGYFPSKMTVQELNSRLFYVRGEDNLELALGEGKAPLRVEKGRCLYLARFELSLAGQNPELPGEQFELLVRTTKENISYQKGLGGGHRGWVGKEIPFEELVKSAQFPNTRTKDTAVLSVREALEEIFAGYDYNCNFRIFSEFEGSRQGLGNQFDKIGTYLPMIVKASKEILDQLK